MMFFLQNRTFYSIYQFLFYNQQLKHQFNLYLMTIYYYSQVIKNINIFNHQKVDFSSKLKNIKS